MYLSTGSYRAEEAPKTCESLLALSFFLFSHSWYFSSQIWNFDKITQNILGFHMELREIKPSPRASRLPLHQYSILKNIWITQSYCPTVQDQANVLFPILWTFFSEHSQIPFAVSQRVHFVCTLLLYISVESGLFRRIPLYEPFYRVKNLIRRFDFMAKSLCK